MHADQISDRHEKTANSSLVSLYVSNFTPGIAVRHSIMQTAGCRHETGCWEVLELPVRI